VQRLVSGTQGVLDGEEISQRIGAAEGAGSVLDASITQQLHEALGADPGEIRVHTDGEAHDLSESLGAKAFTSGRVIFFKSGAFDPGSPEGFELLLHESTHVLQQAQGPVDGTPTQDGALAISDPGDPFEQAATSQAGALAPPAPVAPGRPVQRWPDVDDLLGVAEKSGQPPGPLPGMLGSFGTAISDDASSGNLGLGTLTKAAKAEEARESAEGANIRASRKEFDSDVDAATQWMGNGAGSRFAGGAVKEAWGIGSGLDSMIQNPLGFQKAQSESASKEALPMVTNQYFDTLGKVSRGEEGLGGAASELFGAYAKGKDNELAAKEAAAKPITDDVKSGNYAGAFGRLGTQVGVAILGMGEEGPLGEVSAEASAAEESGAAVKQAGTSEAGLVPGEVPPGSTGPKTLPGVAPDPNPLPDLGPATEPGGPSTLPGVAPDPNPLPDLGPATVPDPPTLPGLGPDLGPLTTPDPLTSPGLGEPPGPLTSPGLGEPPGPLTSPGLGEPPGPNPLPDVPPDSSPPATLESPTEFQGERVPGDSPLATSVRDPPTGEPGPSPGGDPNTPPTQRSAGNEPPAGEQAPESGANGPATADGDQLANAQEEFEQAWSKFSKEPFGYGLLPGWKP
jgi:hypothetical protein